MLLDFIIWFWAVCTNLEGPGQYKSIVFGVFDHPAEITIGIVLDKTAAVLVCNLPVMSEFFMDLCNNSIKFRFGLIAGIPLGTVNQVLYGP